MLNFVTRDTSGFHSFKGTPENLQELDETLAFFLGEQIKFDSKRLSRQRITNLKKLFTGLAQTRKLAEQESKNDLLEEVNRKSKELEHYNSELELGEALMKQFTSLMSRVVESSDRFIIKAKKFLTGDKPKAVFDLENFLEDNNLKLSDFDEYDVERLKKYEVNFNTK